MIGLLRNPAGVARKHVGDSAAIKSGTGRKTTIEECLTLSMKELRRRGVLRHGATGTISWTRPTGDTYRVGFRCDLRSDPPRLWLSYTVTDQAGQQTDHHSAAPLDADPCRLGGQQWYFRCPSCDRRVRQLHMPPGEHTFACRHCYHLTYLSTQGQHARRQG